MQQSFSALLRHGFEQALSHHRREIEEGSALEPILAGIALEELPSLSRDPFQPLRHQDLVSAAMIRCYRRGPAEPWGAILLEALCPRLVALATLFESRTSSIGSDDIEQQLVIEILEGVRRLNIAASFRYVQRRLALRAATEVDRWLTYANRTPRPRLVARDLDEREIRRAEALFELADLTGAGGEDLAFMLHLLAEPEEAVAAELG